MLHSIQRKFEHSRIVIQTKMQINTPNQLCTIAYTTDKDKILSEFCLG